MRSIPWSPGPAPPINRHLAWSRPAFADTLERTSRAAIRLPDGRGVLGTSRGELVVIDPLARALSVIALPAAVARNWTCWT